MMTLFMCLTSSRLQLNAAKVPRQAVILSVQGLIPFDRVET